MHLQGTSQQRIAQEVGVSQATVCRDLRAIQREWMRSALRDLDDLKAREVAQVDNLERELWAAWDASRRELRVSRTRRRAGVGSSEFEQVRTEKTELEQVGTQKNGKKGFREIIVRRESRYGEPRFLEGVEKCIEQRCRIFGLYAPTSINITDLDRMIGAELARIAGATEREQG